MRKGTGREKVRKMVGPDEDSLISDAVQALFSSSHNVGVRNAVLSTNPKPSTVQAVTKKVNSTSARPSTGDNHVCHP